MRIIGHALWLGGVAGMMFVFLAAILSKCGKSSLVDSRTLTCWHHRGRHIAANATQCGYAAGEEMKMTKKIDSLTEKQSAALATYRDKWLKIGLDTIPLDKDKARDAVKQAYKCAGFEEPQTFIFLESPLCGAIGAVFLSKMKVGAQVGAQVRMACYGLHDANWLGFYEYFRRELELPNIEKIDGLIATAQHCGWWWAYKNAVIITPKPTLIHRDENFRLHCENGLALAYPDGWGIYAWHGVRVPAKVIMAPQEITIEEICAEENAEIRRVMIERMGWERFCSIARMRVLHSDELHSGFPAIPVSDLIDAGQRLVTTYRAGTETAELLEAEELRDFEDRPLRFVRLTDPSTGRQYTIRVRHDHKRCYEAIGWTFGVSESVYKTNPYLRQGDVMLRPLTDNHFNQQHS
jgi:hypothetical protein